MPFERHQRLKESNLSTANSANLKILFWNFY